MAASMKPEHPVATNISPNRKRIAERRQAKTNFMDLDFVTDQV
jgi:hypothetical protein